jgi:hypothetical protein
MSDAPDAHLAVVTDRTTGKFHGALYVNKPTPSGCTRYILQYTVNEGHATQRAAAESANLAFPTVEPLDLEAIGAQDVDISGLRLPMRAVVTRIKPRRDGDPQEDAPEVEARLAGNLVPVAISKAQFERMLALGHLEFESTSGRDPGLYYVYDHYEITEVGLLAMGYVRKAAA